MNERLLHSFMGYLSRASNAPSSQGLGLCVKLQNKHNDVMSPKTRASNLPHTRDKPKQKNNYKYKNRCRYGGGSPSIARDSKEYTQTIKEMEMLKMKMTRDITKQVLKNETNM